MRGLVASQYNRTRRASVIGMAYVVVIVGRRRDRERGVVVEDEDEVKRQGGALQAHRSLARSRVRGRGKKERLPFRDAAKHVPDPALVAAAALLDSGSSITTSLR